MNIHHSKIYDIESLSSKVNDAKKEGKKIVLCHGHFNVIHPGHMRFFQFAKQVGDIVIASVCHGSELDPTNQQSFYLQDERAAGVANLELVDYVVKPEANNPINVIATLSPNIYLKGREHEKRQNEIKEEIDCVKSHGGKVIFSSGEVKYTSTSLLNDSLGDAQERKFSNFINNCQKHDLSLEKVRGTLDSFHNLRMLVVGDTIVDRFKACDPLGISSEAPVMVVRELEAKQFVGGAAVIAKHIKSLGADCSFVSVVGNDEIGNFVQNDLEECGIESFLLRDNSRPTTFKTRYLVGTQKVFRVSRLKQHPISQKQEEELIRKLGEIIPNVDGIILSDFVYGLLTNRLLEEVKTMAKKNNVKVYGDAQCSSQVGDVSRMKEIDLITPTEKEARIAMGDPSSGLERLARKLIEKTNNRNIVITLGEQGLLVYGQEGDLNTSEFFPALNPNPVDVAGAGDAMLTGYALGLSSGLSLMESSVLASCMSSLSVTRIGNISLAPDEVRQYLDKLIVFKNNKTNHFVE